MNITTTTRRRWVAILAAATAVLLAACGGGGGIGGTGTGGDGTGGGGGGGGIGGTGAAYGEITGFGSVWVNGVRYDTSSASFRRDDDDNASQSDLRVGMVARVEGDATAGTATRVTVDSALKGRVEQAAADRYMVMGQTVTVDAGTRFENGVRPTLGDYVEVHGLPQTAGTVAATYIERKSTLATPPFVVTGFVAAHDTAASTFTVGALTVSYAGADVSDMPAGSWAGLAVEAKGTACAGTPVCGTLTASKVEPSGPRIASSPKAEIEGYVVSGTVGDFMVAGLRVLTTGSTVFEDGVAADFAIGTKLEAEGPVTDGVMTATKVEFKAGARIEADVLTVVGDRITLAGLPGIEVQLTAQTELKDLASLADVVPGLHVRLRGRPVGDALVVATELEARSPDSDVDLRGSVSAATDPTLTILGVTIDTTGLPDSAFREEDVVIGRTAFFAALGNGRPVEAKGRRNGNTVTWEEFELED